MVAPTSEAAVGGMPLQGDPLQGNVVRQGIPKECAVVPEGVCDAIAMGFAQIVPPLVSIPVAPLDLPNQEDYGFEMLVVGFDLRGSRGPRQPLGQRCLEVWRGGVAGCLSGSGGGVVGQAAVVGEVLGFYSAVRGAVGEAAVLRHNGVLG